MNSKLHDKELELVQTREDIHELGSKISNMYRTPKYDTEHYSSAKLDGWEKQLEKLQGKEQSLLEDITAIKHDPEFIKDLEAKNINIVTRRSKLQAEFAKLKARVFSEQGDRAQTIIDGQDPMKVAQDLYALQDRMEVITLAIEHLNLASKILDKLGEDIPYQPAHAEDWPKGQKFEVPPVVEQYQRFN